MSVLTRQIIEQLDYVSSNKLVEYIFKKYHKFDYKAVSRLSPPFEKIVFNAYCDETDEIIGTITLTRPDEKKIFPSNFYFGFKTPSYVDLATTLEMGRLVKSDKPEHKNNDAYIYISLLLAVKAYSQLKGITRWVASVHNNLLQNILNLGIPVEIIATEPLRMESSIREGMGNYPNNVNFITATMADSFKALEKFQYLIDDGKITIEINKPAL
ncbi:hypothetical protein [Emticicia sp. 21SJ11W-3]|uniref:hypothetical protein n=1 Tax=Emticicia sp. 21SJ11W-3 TaxID=2916755 RepID=UPI00209D177B|nr:hypothetical protein [Emticicia sp. 21SJ11W-3]UTA66956.1 hypothetical protein MB380_15245 [Emticicia sp. 21SJ11W-3]